MQIEIKNISKISDAIIDLNSIAVIAGENNTGKSVVGKALFSVFDLLNDYEEKLKRRKIFEIKRIIKDFLRSFYREQRPNLSLPLGLLISRFENRSMEQISLFDDKQGENKNIIYSLETKIENKEQVDNVFLEDLIEQFNKFISSYSKKPLSDDLVGQLDFGIVNDINKIISMPDNELLTKLLTQKLNEEFGDQINNIYNNQSGNIIVSHQNKSTTVTVEKNIVTKLKNEQSINNSIRYIDDPYILDNMGNNIIPRYDALFLNHRSTLLNDLRKQDDSIFNTTSDVLDKLDNEISGNVVYDPNKLRYVYKEQDSNYEINVENMSSGAKAILVLKTLLQNGSIKKGDILVFDEPEVHLHPKWQVVLAQVMILLQKQMGLKLVITTHSPYFLNAIEILSVKYGISTSYYMTKKSDDGFGQYNIRSVTDSLDKIYKKLAEPFQDIENLKY